MTDADQRIADDEDDEGGIGLLEMALLLGAHRKLLVAGPLLAGLVALGIAFLIPPTFTARTSFMPPQQQQSSAGAALASLGALAGLAGGAGLKTPADQYVALLQSNTVADHLIERFKLMDVYDKKFRVDARKELAGNVRVALGRKDGLISVEVDDKLPQRAAEIANRHVEELRELTSTLAVTEAQQRRVFFEGQLKQTKDKLVQAQVALQASGFSAGAIKAEPKAAAEAYARLRAEVTAAEVRLQAMGSYLNPNAPEFQQAQGTLVALRGQLLKLELPADATGQGADYIGKLREYKYQETLFELFARQYELARVDESREGALIQVVDLATVPEKKSRPQRALIAVAATVGSALLLMMFVVARHFWRESKRDPAALERRARLQQSLEGR